MTSTAKNGNPTQASRGAAVKRAKAALGDAIDAKLNLDIEAMELRLLADTIGCDAAFVRGMLDAATLKQLEEWTKKIAASGGERNEG